MMSNSLLPPTLSTAAHYYATLLPFLSFTIKSHTRFQMNCEGGEGTLTRSKVNSTPVLLPAAGSAHTEKFLEIPKHKDVLAKYDITADLESVGREGFQQSKLK